MPLYLNPATIFPWPSRFARQFPHGKRMEALEEALPRSLKGKIPEDLCGPEAPTKMGLNVGAAVLSGDVSYSSGSYIFIRRGAALGMKNCEEIELSPSPNPQVKTRAERTFHLGGAGAPAHA